IAAVTPSTAAPGYSTEPVAKPTTPRLYLLLSASGETRNSTISLYLRASFIVSAYTCSENRKRGHHSAKMTLFRPNIFTQRTNQSIGFELFHNMGCPSGNSTCHKNRGKSRGIKPHQVVRRAGRIVKIRFNALLRDHSLFESTIQFEHIGAIIMGDHFLHCCLHGRHTRITVLVYPVPKAHDFTLLSERLIEPSPSPISGTLAETDLIENMHYGFIGSAV